MEFNGIMKFPGIMELESKSKMCFRSPAFDMLSMSFIDLRSDVATSFECPARSLMSCKCRDTNQ